MESQQGQGISVGKTWGIASLYSLTSYLRWDFSFPFYSQTSLIKDEEFPLLILTDPPF